MDGLLNALSASEPDNVSLVPIREVKMKIKYVLEVSVDDLAMEQAVNYKPGDLWLRAKVFERVIQEAIDKVGRKNRTWTGTVAALRVEVGE